MKEVNRREAGVGVECRPIRGVPGHGCPWAGLLPLGGIVLLAGCGTTKPGGPLPDTPSTRAPEAVEQVSARKPEAAPEPGTITEVDLGRLLELRDAGMVLLVDVRPSLFYAMGHISGAVSLPKKTFEASWPGRKEQLEAAVAAGKVVVLYCTNEQCPDGYAVARKLAPMGYDVSIYKGGWEEWKMTGFE